MLCTCVVVVVSARGRHGFRVLLLCRPRAVASAFVCGCFSLIARLLRPPRAVALTYVSNCLSVRLPLLRLTHAVLQRSHADDSASARICFGVCAQLLWLPHVFAAASTRWCLVGRAGLLCHQIVMFIKLDT